MAERGELTLIRLSSSSDEEEEETEMEVDRGKRTLIYLSSSSDEEEDTEIEADRGKRTLICLSSSSDEDEDTEIEADRGKRTLICLSSSSDDSNYSGDGNGCNEDDDREMEDYGDCDDGHDAGDDDESICHRVICLLKDGSDLEVLNLKECKVYLRKHGLRLSEPKEVCIQRIMEHWRLKDRNGEALYPRSSFIINCTGDACKGDVVLFTQFHKLARHGGLLGKRTIAGRVVNESYGGAKQQHTFTVEVLWSKSKGLGTLPPLFPLLVKGCKLYRFKTYRQRWDDEAERLKVLSEKHKRGAEARHKRAMKRTKMRPYSKGAKRQKYSNHTVPTPKKKAIETRKTKYLSMRGKALPQHHQRSRQLNFKRAPRSSATNFSGRSQRLKHHNINDCPTLQPYFRCPKPHQSQMRFYDGRTPFYFSSHDMASNSTMMRLQPVRSDADPLPTSFYNLYNGNYSRHVGKFRMELHQKVAEKFATTKTTSYREVVECAQMTEKSDMDTKKYYAATRTQKRGGSSSSRSGGEKKTTMEQSSEQRPEQRIDRRPDRRDDRDYRARGCRGKGFRRGDRDRNPRQPIMVCFNCCQQGHHSNECIDWNCNPCFWCGQLGHKLKDCLVRGFGQQAQQEQHTLLPALQQRALRLAIVGRIQALHAPVPPAQQHGAPGRVFALGYEAAPMDQQGIGGEFIEDYQ